MFLQSQIGVKQASTALTGRVGAFVCVFRSCGKADMDAVRRQRMGLVDFSYNEHGSLDDPCFYCGLPATGWDHVPPIHYSARLPEDIRDQLTLRKVPCCLECNSILGGVVSDDLSERRYYVKARLRRKYAKWLSMPQWDEFDLSELSTDDARRYIQQSLRVVNNVRQRLAWPREIQS